MNAIIIQKDNIDISKELEILEKYKIYNSLENPEYIFSFGGDGTIIKTLKYALEYDIPIIPINYGKVGYLADIEVKDFEKCLIEILNNKFSILNRYILEVKIDNTIYYSLNEVVIKGYNLSNIDIFDQDKKITSYRSDGLIISTPTGSTAYALSAGGSIIHPSLKLINIVAIAPQYLGVRPLILPETNLIVKSDQNIFIDGKKIGKSDSISIKISDKFVKFVEPNSKNYYEILSNKLDWRGSK